MILQQIHDSVWAKRRLLIVIFFCAITSSHSQRWSPDSLQKELRNSRPDSNRARLMWQLASVTYVTNPDTAIQLAQTALYLAKRLKYLDGESRSLGILANSFMFIGNYPQALQLNLQKLQLEETRDRPRNLSSVLMNIGIIYRFQEDYDRALEYYSRADSVIAQRNVEDFKHNIALNIGDAYDRRGEFDSSYKYYKRSLIIARERADDDLIGKSMTGLAHIYRKTGNNAESLLTYRAAIDYLRAAGNDEELCEAALGLATLFENVKEPDSARYYGDLSFSIAKEDGFVSAEYDACEFLMSHYKNTKRIDSAFAYAEYSREWNDSLNSKAKIRQLQILSSNEQFRQRQLEEERLLAAKRRHEQLQLLLIGMFIPGLFVLTLLLSKQRIHIRVIKTLGILTLLFFFEYLTLWLHPTVAELTGHTPILEILIFVCVAAVLIPLHHRAEHVLINRLIQHRVFRGQTKKIHLAESVDEK